MNLLLHESFSRALEQFLHKPGHALLLIAPPGAGKATLARYVSGRLLQVPEDELENYPYFRLVRPTAGKSISISEVRDVIHFLTLRTTGSGKVTRVVVIEDAEALTIQAQNALLKTLEEPPEGTVLIMTAANERHLLGTIRSRMQELNVPMPPIVLTRNYFIEKGNAEAAVEKALLISGGLPGLMTALLHDDTEHSLYAATKTAREILQKTTFERLVMAEELAKQRQLWVDTLYILGQMASAAIAHSRGGQEAKSRWHKVLASVYSAAGETEHNGQLKLVMLNFMLTL